MATNRSNYDYEEIIKNFGREKIIKRYNTLRQYMEQYIQRAEYSGKVQIADSVLNQVLIDYFADIDRLKISIRLIRSIIRKSTPTQPTGSSGTHPCRLWKMMMKIRSSHL